jgi:hypothetical protein
MSAVSSTYFVMAPECLGLIPFFKNNVAVAYPFGIIFAVAMLAIFIVKTRKYADSNASAVHHAHA